MEFSVADTPLRVVSSFSASLPTPPLVVCPWFIFFEYIMSCEPNNHNYQLEPIQTVSRVIENGEVHSVTMFLQHCTKCEQSNEICKPEDYQFINQNAP